MNAAVATPAGTPAAVTTWYLEMLTPSQLRPARVPQPEPPILRVEVPSPALNRDLYRTVGRDWHWRDRLAWSHEQWTQYLDRPEVQTWVMYAANRASGYVELEKQPGGAVEIAYFGLLRKFTGRGMGGHLLTVSIRRAWEMGARRVWVHTCSLDHPAALANYQARGMSVYKTETGTKELHEIGPDEAHTLLTVARASIRHGLDHQCPLAISPEEHPAALRVPTCCFVSLYRFGALRGCVGSVEAKRALIKDAAENAYAAAFRDARFPPLDAHEFDTLELSIHVLGPIVPIAFTGLPDLYAQLRPGTDGLVVQRGRKHGVFLPAMWRQLPTAEEFVTHLLHKAGIRPEQADTNLEASRFRVQEINESTHQIELKAAPPNP